MGLPGGSRTACSRGYLLGRIPGPFVGGRFGVPEVSYRAWEASASRAAHRRPAARVRCEVVESLVLKAATGGRCAESAAKKKTIIVVAHAMLVIVWHVLATGTPYHDLGADYFTTRLDGSSLF